MTLGLQLCPAQLGTSLWAPAFLTPAARLENCLYWLECVRGREWKRRKEGRGAVGVAKAVMSHQDIEGRPVPLGSDLSPHWPAGPSLENPWGIHQSLEHVLTLHGQEEDFPQSFKTCTRATDAGGPKHLWIRRNSGSPPPSRALSFPSPQLSII